MKRNLLLLLIAFSLTTGAIAQSVLLERDLSESVYLKKKGPDKKRFSHLYYDYSVYEPGENDDIYKFGYCYRAFVGLRTNYRISSFYAMGLALEFGWENFRIGQNEQKTFPSAGVHKKETIGTSNIGMEYFNRLILSRREHSLGVWLDAGVYGNLNLNSRHIIKDKAASTAEVRYHKEINRGLKYLSQTEYGVKARVGYKRYGITGSYRLSDWMAASNSIYEPPRITFGFELGFY